MSPHTDAGALLKLADDLENFGHCWCLEERRRATIIASLRQAASHGREGGEKQASDAPVWYAHAEAHAWADGYNAALSPPVKTGDLQ